VSDRVRDRLWLWGHAAGAHNADWNLPRPSRITPLEAACYLGIPNLLMVRYGDTPVMPYDQLALPLRALRRVVWSLTGAEGTGSEAERAHVLDLATRMPNLTGCVLDDFINWDTGQPELSLAELDAINARLQLSERRLDLQMVLYTHQLTAPAFEFAPYLARCNQLSLWTWHARDLPQLEASLARLEALAPQHDIFIGCYVWDLGPRAPMPLAPFQAQCEQALGWLRAGRIAGLIVLPSCMCDLELETVEWLRGWIAAVGDEALRHGAMGRVDETS
jgi:hypothetical protein